MKNKISESYWNYRFIEKPIYEKDKEVDKYYELIEVYYGNNGQIVAWNDTSNNVIADSLDDLNVFIKQIKLASKNTVMKLVNKKLVDTKEYMRKK